ncbi:LAETG motif-containing sortase-dependent surface protein [Streptomyces paludis]|uniref:LAETG motif-containing sortase-dependent surface protein n=1 Tax=Streptomyces paludis TaxID=2282738 RepID=UPI0013B39D23|nr:LAETG motif-containing sortase-dependent surface protein [Streptomyces paludis]
MTLFNRSWQRSGALITVVAASALGVGLTAAPAFAHTPTWNVTCDQVSLNLTAYGNSDKNTVTVTVDGKDLLPTENFRNNFKKTLDLPDHSSELTVRLVVDAADGDRFNKDETKTAPVCPGKEEPSPSPSETQPTEEPTDEPSATPSEPAPSEEPPTEEPTTETPESSAPPADASTPPVDEPSPVPSPNGGGDLAETGSSSATPLIAGAAGVVLVAGAGIMWAARKRRSAQG